MICQKRKYVLEKYLVKKTTKETGDSKFNFIINEDLARNACTVIKREYGNDLVGGLQQDNWNITLDNFQRFFISVESKLIEVIRSNELVQMTMDEPPYKLVIHTNKDKTEAIKNLKQLGVLEYFERIYTPADLGLYAKLSHKNYQILTEEKLGLTLNYRIPVK